MRALLRCVGVVPCGADIVVPFPCRTLCLLEMIGASLLHPGPVVAAACFVPPGVDIRGVQDSKKVLTYTHEHAFLDVAAAAATAQRPSLLLGIASRMLTFLFFLLFLLLLVWMYCSPLRLLCVGLYIAPKSRPGCCNFQFSAAGCSAQRPRGPVQGVDGEPGGCLGHVGSREPPHRRDQHSGGHQRGHDCASLIAFFSLSCTVRVYGPVR